MKERQQKIKQIENLIQQTQSTLTLWNKEIEKYSLTLQQLTKQLNEIKKQITNK